MRNKFFRQLFDWRIVLDNHCTKTRKGIFPVNRKTNKSNNFRHFPFLATGQKAQGASKEKVVGFPLLTDKIILLETKDYNFYH